MSSPEYRSIVQDWPECDRGVFPESAFQYFETTSSTNTILRERLQRGEAGHFSVIAADHQTAGRGRRGDRWEATPGSNLLFSLALELPQEPRLWSRLPHLTAMYVADAVDSVLTKEQRIQAKWPNDLYFDSRKLCGILVETITVPRPFAVVGVGLNVNMKHSEFPEELFSVATSICEIEGCEANRWYLLSLILGAFQSGYPEGLSDFDRVLDWYRRSDFLFGKNIEVSTVTGQISGQASGIGRDGELLIEMESGEVLSIVSAERIDLC